MVFIYNCNGKYSKRNIRNFIKHIKIDSITRCWEWVGAICHNWYGIFVIRINGRKIYLNAHRVSVEMATGILIPDGKVVLHKCDNPKCCYPNHLKVGTQQDNISDMVLKGRQKRGENCNFSKLTIKKVNEIRNKWNTGKYSIQQLADEYLICIGTISYIINNVNWHDPSYIKIHKPHQTRGQSDETQWGRRGSKQYW